jgi:hypothetical protein
MKNGHFDTNFAASDGVIQIDIDHVLHDLPLVKVIFLLLGADDGLLFT